MTTPIVVPTPPHPIRPIVPRAVETRTAPEGPTLRIVQWVDPVADPHGMHPCSRYVELYWLGIIGPSTTWLLRRLNYGLEVHGDGFDLNLPETARSLGLGDKMGKNSPFRRALARLNTFELARAQGPGELAVRAHIPPLPLRHLVRLPDSLQRSHRRWLAEQQLSEPEQMRRRAIRLATGLAQSGHDRVTIEQRLAEWRFHPAVAFHAAGVASDGRTRPASDGARPLLRWRRYRSGCTPTHRWRHLGRSIRCFPISRSSPLRPTWRTPRVSPARPRGPPGSGPSRCRPAPSRLSRPCRSSGRSAGRGRGARPAPGRRWRC